MLLVAAVVCGTAGEVINAAAGNPSKLSRHTVLLYGGSALALWAVAVVLLLFSISRFNRARRSAECQTQQATARQLAAEHMTRARQLAGQLLAGQAPTVNQVWDVVLAPGERVLLDGTAGYARYYGYRAPTAHTPIGTSHRNTGQGNGRHAGGTAAALAARWRDQQQSRVVLTDRRLLCKDQTNGWVSFEHATATAIQPAPATQSVVLEYPETAPVRLSGPLSAEIMVIIVWALYGANGLRQHPALADVRAGAPLPEVTAAASQPLDTEPPTASIPALSDDMSAEQQVAGSEQPAEAPSLDLLAFVATHELVLAEHAARLLGVSEEAAAVRLEQLIEQGLVCRVRLSVDTPTAYLITQQGADQVDLASPASCVLDLADYAQAVATNER